MSDRKMGGETHLSPRSTEKGLNYNKVAAGFPLSSVWAPPLNHTGVFCRIDLHWTRSSKGLIKKWKRPFRNAFCSNYMIRNKVAAFQCGSRRPRCHSWRSPSIKASMGGRLAPDNIFVIQPYHHHHHHPIHIIIINPHSISSSCSPNLSPFSIIFTAVTGVLTWTRSSQMNLSNIE